MDAFTAKTVAIVLTRPIAWMPLLPKQWLLLWRGYCMDAFTAKAVAIPPAGPIARPPLLPKWGAIALAKHYAQQPFCQNGGCPINSAVLLFPQAQDSHHFLNPTF